MLQELLLHQAEK